MSSFSEPLPKGEGHYPDPLLTNEAVSTQWATPQLNLRVWATYRLIQVYAYVVWVNDDGEQVFVEVARHLWLAGERPTERDVVLWGYKALGEWLGEEMTL
jgi:hypothetical protein